MEMKQEPSCQETAEEERQTKCALTCKEKIVAKGHHKLANQSQTERVEGWQKFRWERGVWVFLVPHCCLQKHWQGSVSKNIANLCVDDKIYLKGDNSRQTIRRTILL